MKNGGVIKGLELRAHRGDRGREKEEEKREQIQTANPKQRGGETNECGNVGPCTEDYCNPLFLHIPQENVRVVYF